MGPSRHVSEEPGSLAACFTWSWLGDAGAVLLRGCMALRWEIARLPDQAEAEARKHTAAMETALGRLHRADNAHRHPSDALDACSPAASPCMRADMPFACAPACPTLHPRRHARCMRTAVTRSILLGAARQLRWVGRCLPKTLLIAFMCQSAHAALHSRCMHAAAVHAKGGDGACAQGC